MGNTASVQQSLVEKVELLFLTKITTHLRSGALSAAHARKLAHDFKQLRPFHSPEDLQQKMKQFSEKNHGFTELHQHTLLHAKEEKTGVFGRILQFFESVLKPF